MPRRNPAAAAIRARSIVRSAARDLDGAGTWAMSVEVDTLFFLSCFWLVSDNVACSIPGVNVFRLQRFQ
jgi:hypothetical protein